MLAFLISSSAQKNYQGWQSQPIQEAAQESYNIIECPFVEIGGDSSSSALRLPGRYNINVNIFACHIIP
ncbi:hypothetical protein TVAG_406740 [Trichomonas vaginalis G3]|uniref:Uncharacterized protein n=1 Tax=Trichomonas vaginalis (strain ATCC PRA-98 / G3) TaxID=412133 RepID=A2FIC4_TRIV3|nr:hypothetical protein TVAG_406740 [Trichomonas vaginalis G3]|eukprot:XP_001308256.1 hypothetical protein [Trichomonas vaginalis G3]